MSTLAYEVNAGWARDAGDMQSACMFQRAAHLSHGSVKRWQNADGSLQIVKNHFPPTDRWGYEEYSYFSQYNLLPAAMLAAAFAYADPNDSIPECAAPADVGGFVFELPEHHLVIANAGGVYAEIETASDPHYDSTGLHRVHINTCGVGTPGACVAVHALITPTAGPPCPEGIAFGPWWSTAADPTGSRTALSTFNYTDIAGISLSPTWTTTGNNVSFSLEYFLLGSVGGIVTQTYAIAVGTDGSAPDIQLSSQIQLLGGSEVVSRMQQRNVAVPQAHLDRATASGVMDASWAASPAANITRFGLQLPIFLFDGVTNTTVAVNGAANGGSATLSGPATSGWGSAIFSVVPDGRDLSWTYDNTTQTVSRNGLMGTVWIETQFGTQTPSMVMKLTGSN